MATVKLHLDQRRARKDGTHPLVIRLRNANKYIDIPTGMNLSIQEFDPVREYIKGKQKLSSDLQQQKNQYAVQFSNLIAKGITFEEIKNLMLNKEKETSPITLESFWQDEITRLSSIGRAGGARVYLSSLKGLSKVMDLSIPLKDLKHKNLMLAEAEMRKNGVSYNSISVYMRTLRAL